MSKDGFVGTHNGECGGDVTESPSSKRTVTMGGVGGKTAVMVCSRCDRVVPDDELVSKKD